MVIYMITNRVNGKQYIGQTTKSLEERIRTHYNSFIGKKDTHLYRAMRKYGWDNFEFKIIDNAATKSELNQLEIYYIEKYDTIRTGYNMVAGGDNNVMGIAAVRQKHLNSMRSPEVRKKISDTLKQRCKLYGVSEAHKKHLSENKKRFYASERGQEAKLKFKETFKLSDSHKLALNKSRYKSVYCIDESANIIAEFDSVKAGALWWESQGYVVKHLNTISDAIKRSADNDRYVKGLKWVYRV